MGLKVGDRVKFIDDSNNMSDIFLYGEYGTVRVFEGSFVGVEFDNEFDDCHTLNGNSKEDHGWWCKEKKLILVEHKIDSEKNTEHLLKANFKYIGIHILFKNGKIVKNIFEVDKDEDTNNAYNNILEAIKKEKNDKNYITTPNYLIVDVDDISAIKIVEGENKHIASKDVFEVIK